MAGFGHLPAAGRAPAEHGHRPRKPREPIHQARERRAARNRLLVAAGRSIDVARESLPSGPAERLRVTIAIAQFPQRTAKRELLCPVERKYSAPISVPMTGSPTLGDSVRRGRIRREVRPLGAQLPQSIGQALGSLMRR